MSQQIMGNPLVSVIIPNYNYAKYLSKTVDSVLGQTYANVEVIVVDDASTDDSLAVLAGFGDQIKSIAQKNQGVSIARNNGAAAAAGEFVAFLDADDIWLPTKLERQMEMILNDGEIGLVHCSMTYIDTADLPLGEMTDGMGGSVADEILRFRRGVVIGAGSTSLVPKAIFEEVGGFDPRMSTAADWDFSYRIASRYKIGFVTEPLVLYRIHGSNMHGNVAAMEHDMILSLNNAFAHGAAGNGREGYGNVYKTLAGSYFRSGNFPAFLRTAALGVYYRPANLAYFAGFPLRKILRGAKEAR